MPHVGDGDIHAYLDGALELYPADRAEAIRTHLSTCPDCASRVETERALRARADDILAGAGLADPEIPPFEELRARAAAASSSVRSGSRWPLSPGLAWAASLLLALAVGWAGRGVLVPPDRVLEPIATPAVIESGDGDRGREAVPGDARSEDRERATTPAAELRDELDEPEPSTGSDPRRAVAEVGEEAAPPPEQARNEASTEAVDLVGGVPSRLTAEAPTSMRPAGAPAEQRTFAASTTEAQMPEAEGLEDVGPPVARRDGDDPSLPDSAGERFRAGPPPMPVLPGLEVRSVRAAPEADGAVEVVQILPGGAELRLVQGVGRPPAAFAGAGPASPAAGTGDRLRQSELAKADGASNAVLLTLADRWTWISGPVAPDSLQALLRRLNGAR